MGVINWARRSSPWILHYNTGGCNACDIEVLAALIPRFDAERFGVLLKGSPRHADILVVTGPQNEMTKPRLKRIYEQMPEPKFVVAVGSCCISSGVYRGCYNVISDGLDSIIPVTANVYGCPPRPEAVLKVVYAFQEALKASQKTEEEEVEAIAE